MRRFADCVVFDLAFGLDNSTKLTFAERISDEIDGISPNFTCTDALECLWS